MVATTHGRAQVADLEAAVEDDGTITALRMKVTANIGAYPVFTFIPDLTLFMGVGVYKFTDVDLRATCVFTNTTTVAAYRGAGRPEAAYYLERLIDIVAAELGMTPEEVRRKNFIPPSAFPYATPTGQNYDSGEYDRALTKALELAGLEKLRREQTERIDRAATARCSASAMAVLRRDVRVRPLRERGRARGALRRGDRLHRHLGPRSGARDDVRPDHRRPPRRGLRQDRRPPR